jgi:hypothetical protein
MNSERLIPVYIETVDSAHQPKGNRVYRGLAPLDANFGIIGRTFGIQPERLLNGEVMDGRHFKFWVLTVAGW